MTDKDEFVNKRIRHLFSRREPPLKTKNVIGIGLFLWISQLNMGTFLALPAAWAAAGAILGFIITGSLFVLGIFRKEKKADTKDGEDALTFVNSALEKKIRILEDKVDTQEKGLEAMGLRLVAIEKENALLREILQGRDEKAVEFQTKGLEVINTAVPEILELTKATNKNVNQLCKSIDGLVKAMNVKTTTTVTTVPVQPE